MAVRTVAQTSVTTGWNKTIFFPKDNYIVRCIAEKFAPSAKGHPMVTLTWEVVNQAPKQIGDKIVEFDGVKFDSYHVIKCVDPELSAEARQAKSDKWFLDYQEKVLARCGIDVSNGWDDENPPSVKGKVVHALVWGKENAQRREPTPEQRSKGELGDIIKDPLTDKECVSYYPQMEQIYGVANVEVTRPW